MRIGLPLVAALLSLAALGAAGQGAPAADARPPIEPIPDPVSFPPAALAWVNPLHVAADTPAKLPERPALPDFVSSETLLVAVRLEETGKVVEAVAVEPPLRAFGPLVAQLSPRWTFKAARKDGQVVKTWATLAIDLAVEVEDAALASLELVPVGKADPAPLIGSDAPPERLIVRYPKEPEPRENGVVSVEAVDFLPMPDKAPWKAESAKLRSRLSALVEVTAQGQVRRLVPVGTENEALVVRWFRRACQGWRLAPAQRDGAPIDSWSVLEATVEYSLGSAKETGRRSMRKNLRGAPRR